jgi:hypothetical protein
MHRYYIILSSHTKGGLYKLLRSTSFNRYTKLFCCLNFRRYAKRPNLLYHGLPCSVMLRSVEWKLGTQVSAQPERPITASH